MVKQYCFTPNVERSELYSFIGMLPIVWHGSPTVARAAVPVHSNLQLLSFAAWHAGWPQEAARYAHDQARDNEPFTQLVAGQQIAQLVVRVAGGVVSLAELVEWQSAVVAYEVVIIVAAGAQVTVHDVRSDAALINHLVRSVTYYVERGAHVQIYEEQWLPEHVQEISYSSYYAQQDAQVTIGAVLCGGALTRANYRCVVQGVGAYVQLRGVYALHQQQQLVVSTVQHHRQPKTESEVLFKGILAQASSALYCGSIDVDQVAAGTVARQKSTALLLGNQARAHAVPGLQVHTHDVQCMHGAAIGQLDEAHIAYLKARGLSHEKSSEIMINGFFAEHSDLFYTGPDFERIMQRMTAKLHNGFLKK